MLITLRMRLLYVSAIYRLPAESRDTPKGLDIWALIASPLSPENPLAPVPATVVIVPPLTLRMRLLARSAIYRLPAMSTETLSGEFNSALVAGPLSPEYPPTPFPATVVII